MHSNEGEMWKWINKVRKKDKSATSTEGNTKGWGEWFKQKLKGSENKEAEEEEISTSKIIAQISKFKTGKACGGDSIPNKAWIHMPKEFRISQ